MDFFIHDHFVGHAPELLLETIKQCSASGVEQILCYVPQADELKIHCLKQVGAILQARLPHQLRINGQWQDTLIYGCQDN
jgi:hypothetical protein